MGNVISVCRVYVIFLAFSGFLFGQLFSGNFDWAATFAGVFGLLSGSLGASKSSLSSRSYAIVAIVFCLLGIIGVGFDALDYYRNYNSPGGYYAWHLIGPYIACLAAIVCYMLYKLPPKQ